MNSRKSISPEMHSVLAEVLAQSSSKLIAPNPACVRSIDFGMPVSSGEPFLTSAERKLIGGYRDELEWVYRRWAHVALYGGEWGQREMIGAKRYLNNSVQGLTAFGKDGRVKLRSGLMLEDPRQVLAMSDQQLAQLALECLSQAQSLIVRDSTKTMMGIAHIRANQFRTASKLFSAVLLGSFDGVQKYYAGLNLGALYLRVGDPPSALRLLEGMPSDPSMSLSRECLLVLSSGLLLDWDRLRYWSSSITAAGGLKHSSIPEWISTMRQTPEIDQLRTQVKRHPELLEFELLRALVESC